MSFANTVYLVAALLLIGFGVKVLLTGYVTLGVEATCVGTPLHGVAARLLGTFVVIGGVVLVYLAVTGAADTVFTHTR